MTWQWKKDLRLTDDDDSAWASYDAADQARIEAAATKFKSFKLSNEYKIDFAQMIQHRIEDKNRQRPIRRLGDAPKAEPKKSAAKSKAKSAAPKAASAPAANKKAKTTSAGTTTSGRARVHDLQPYRKLLFRKGASSKKKKGDDDAWRPEEGGSDEGSDVDEDEMMPDVVQLSKIADDLPAKGKNIQYGDLCYFDDYRGVGLYVVGKRGSALVLLKTLGEFGYVLPKEIRAAFPRSHFRNDDTVSFGFDTLDENGDADASDGDFD